jgi:Zn-dependent peptidase ImmA (M78 family)
VPTIQTLRDVRERLLQFRLDTAARFAGLTSERLTVLEAGAEPSVYEAEMLSRVYGIDAEILAEEPIRLSPGDSIETLALLDEFRETSETIRYRIVQAANAARDLIRLRQLLPLTSREAYDHSLPRLPVRQRVLLPHRQGALHAQELRRTLGLGTDPIQSMRDLLATHFPTIHLLHARLTEHGPAGLTFADRLRGTTIVLNLDGKNENPCVRRFSLAHELYHVLRDWNRTEPLAAISGFLTDTSLDIERRANAFAMRLLCPSSRLRAIGSVPELGAVMREYGVHYAAMRLYLLKEGGKSFPAQPPPPLLGAGIDTKWFDAEEPVGLARFPLPEVPEERRTILSQIAAELHSAGVISRTHLAGAMGVTPATEVERVLDYLGLDPPPRGA